nr:MAG TPA: hypothetical protein [Caudoviricetes sp.]
MKARVKATGEIVEVEDLYDDGTALVKGGYFKVSKLDFFEDFETIDWEQRRYEIAKAAMQGILCAPVVEGIDPNPTPWELARVAVRNADALIKELKKGEWYK